MKKNLFIVLTAFIFVLFIPSIVFAQTTPGFEEGNSSSQDAATLKRAINRDAGCIYTSFGCFPFGNINRLAATFMAFGIGIGSGVALFSLVYASFMIMTSQGVPQRLQNGKSVLYATISGLMLIIFSTFLLRLFGIEVLGLF